MENAPRTTLGRVPVGSVEPFRSRGTSGRIPGDSIDAGKQFLPSGGS